VLRYAARASIQAKGGPTLKKAVLVLAVCAVVACFAGTSFGQGFYTKTVVSACGHPQALAVKPNSPVCFSAQVLGCYGYYCSPYLAPDDGTVCFYDTTSQTTISCDYLYYGRAKNCIKHATSNMDVVAFYFDNVDYDEPSSTSEGFHLFVDPTSTSFGCTGS